MSMDAFDVLGVLPNSDKETCKQAYRRLAMQHHPDKGGDTAMFQSIQKAWNDIDSGYRRFIRKAPEAPRQSQHKTTFKNPRAATFNEVFQNFVDANANASWGSNSAHVVNCVVSQHEQDFSHGGFTFNIPAGTPDGWTKDLLGRHEMVGNSGTVHRTFKIRLQTPHDESMRIQGIDGTLGRLPFTNAIGDAVCAINTNAINLIVGAWVQIRDVFNIAHTVRIPEGFNPEHRLRIAGAGYYHWDAQNRKPILNSRGDLYVQVIPQFTNWENLPTMDKKHASKKLKEIINNA